MDELLPQEALDAWTDYEAPEGEYGIPRLRHAFMSGFLAARPTQPSGVTEAIRAAIYRVMDKRPFVRLGQDTVDELANEVAIAMRSAAPTSGEVERVIAEIERYGEGLVPELRIVTNWLVSHFRDPEVRAELALATASPDERALREISRVIAANPIDGPSNAFTLFATIRATANTALAEVGGTKAREGTGG